jgi:hypothetical protein
LFIGISQVANHKGEIMSVKLIKTVGKLCLGFSIFMLLATSALADNGEFTVGTEVSYINYEEPGVMEQEGIMYGVYSKYNHDVGTPLVLDELADIIGNFSSNSNLMFEGLFKFGQVDYESPVSGTLDDITDYMFEVRGMYGYNIPLASETTLKPYIGLGFRYLNDDSAGMRTSVGHYGYERESNYLYLPIGLSTHTDIDEDWSVGINLEFDVFLYGQQKSHLEDVSTSLNTIENDQNNGYGARVSIELARTSDKYDLVLEPFVRYWDIDDSSTAVVTCGGTPCAVGYEPKNESLDAGIRFGIRY